MKHKIGSFVKVNYNGTKGIYRVAAYVENDETEIIIEVPFPVGDIHGWDYKIKPYAYDKYKLDKRKRYWFVCYREYEFIKNIGEIEL